MIAFILIGGLAGICSGIFGIGGGVILVPILVYLMGFGQAAANGTSLVALLLPVGGLGAYEYYTQGKIAAPQIKAGLWIALGLFIGGYFGAKIAVVLPEQILRRVFATFLFCVSIKMFLQS